MKDVDKAPERKFGGSLMLLRIFQISIVKSLSHELQVVHQNLGLIFDRAYFQEELLSENYQFLGTSSL